MGQCVFRDLGFEFESDPKKQQAFETYLLEVSFLYFSSNKIIKETSSKISSILFSKRA